MKLLKIIIITFFSVKGYSQFIEPGISSGFNSYSGDIKRGYSLTNSSLGFEVFNRFNISSHQSVKISYKRGTIKGREKINDALSINRDMSFESQFSEISIKNEYNFLDYFDEIERENFTPYLFFGLGGSLLKNKKNRNNPISNNKKLFINIPFGLGFKYLINKQFSLAVELEVKKTFYDKIDYLTGATKNIDNITGLDFNNSQKTISMEGKYNDFYYFTELVVIYSIEYHAPKLCT